MSYFPDIEGGMARAHRKQMKENAMNEDYYIPTEAPYRGQDALNVPKTRKQVLGAVDSLSGQQEEEAKLVETLEQALQGVLRPSAPVESDNSAKDSTVVVPLADMIGCCSARQAKLNRQLQSILTRLEV